MFIAIAVTGFDERKTRQGTVGEIGKVSRYRRDVIRVDTKRICGVADDAGRLQWRSARGPRRILIQELGRVAKCIKNQLREIQRSRSCHIRRCLQCKDPA